MSLTNKSLLHQYYGRAFKAGKYWKLNVQHNGVRKSFYSKEEGDAGRKDCAQQAVTWRNQGSHKIKDTTPVDTLYKKFLADKALETTDIYNYNNRYKNHIQPIIGNIAIGQLSVQDMRRVINTAFSKKKLSKKSLKNLRGDMSCFCAWLFDADIRTDLTTTRVKIPRNARQSEKQTLRAEDIATLFTADTTIYAGNECADYWINAYRMQVLYGLRPGELMGLEWCDIDNDNDAIHLRRAINAKSVETVMKNEFAPRTLPLTPMAKDILAAQQMLRHNANNPQERVFGELSQLCYRDRWRVYCDYHNIPYITPYELRHTCASVNKYMDTWMMDMILGHKPAGMTLGTYTHALDGDMDTAADKLDANLRTQITRGLDKLTSN